MIEINLEEVTNALDVTRLALHVNLESTDSNRAESWHVFVDELNQLKELLNKIPTDSNVSVVGVTQ